MAVRGFSYWLLGLALSAGCAYGDEFAAHGWKVVWNDSSLSFSSAGFTQEWRVKDGALTTGVFGAAPSGKSAGTLAVTAEEGRWSAAGAPGVRVAATVDGRTWRFLAPEGAPGVVLWLPADLPVASGAAHVRLAEFQFMDQTDTHNELLTTREWLLMSCEGPFDLTCPLATLEDVFTGRGHAFLRLAPLPHARTTKACDLRVSGARSNLRTFTLTANGAPMAFVSYSGGAVGRVEALQDLQRGLRRYVPGRDGQFLSNTWGDGNRDSRINEEFMRKEIEAGAEIGVDVIQIDDGWQKGRSSNSVAARGKGVWNGYWAADPNFWDPDPTRFPHGLKPLIDAAAAKGMRFGLWFGPDSSNDAANWSKDADWLLGLWKQGIPYFKIDSMKSRSETALARQRAFFDRMLEGSSSAMVFDLDVTAEIRPGYFGMPDVGTIFVENRYSARHRYWPHQTLRSVWTLAQGVDPVRLRMEVVNPDTGASFYGDDPLAPKAYRPDTLFAIAMVASPLGWFENSGLSASMRAALKPLVSRWKAERANLHGGHTWPVGAKPDGVSWTGFVTRGADSASGYALLFREAAQAPDYSVELSPYAIDAVRAEVIGGRGSAEVRGNRLTVTVPEPLDFVWVKLTR